MSNHVSTLQKLGLSDKESKVYLSLLTLGQGSANTIARSTGLKRPTTYAVIEDLRTKGLVLKMPGIKKQMFSARSPEEFIAEVRNNLTEAESALPELMNTYSRNTPHVRTIHFEGLSGIREALWYGIDSLKNKEIVAFYGSMEKPNPELTNLFHLWNEKLADQDTKVRSLTPNNNNLKEFRRRDAIYGFLPKILSSSVYTSQVSIDISDTFVRILMFKEQQATIIENPKVAKAMKEIFEIIWKD